MSRRMTRSMHQADQAEVTDVEEPLGTTNQRSTDSNNLNRPITGNLTQTQLTANGEQDAILGEFSSIDLSTKKVASHGSKDGEKEQIPSTSKSLSDEEKKKKRRLKDEALSRALELLHMETVRNLAIERPPAAPGTYDVNLFNNPGTTTFSPTNSIRFEPGHQLDYNILFRQEFIDELHENDTPTPDTDKV
ncbi:unnamed protein product [Orchesella dallaii]|uniref:Uncharacterized protein n=1 Tax=Orchesella dallaii TaxID=48710 RepID=A0ABP1RS17_9HEXA